MDEGKNAGVKDVFEGEQEESGVQVLRRQKEDEKEDKRSRKDRHKTQMKKKKEYVSFKRCLREKQEKRNGM